MAKTEIENYVDNDTRNIYNSVALNESIEKKYGLTKEIIEEISKDKNEPDWVLDIRLKALDTFFELEYPDWGPDISYLNIENIATYVKPNTDENYTWDDVPDDFRCPLCGAVKNMFKAL